MHRCLFFVATMQQLIRTVWREHQDRYRYHTRSPRSTTDTPRLCGESKRTSHQQQRLNRVQLGPLATLARSLSAMVAQGKTPRAIETQPKLIPAQCAQVCWKTHQKQRSAQKYQRRTCARTTTKAQWQLRKSRRCSSEHHEWCKHNPEDLGPECIDPPFSTKQSYPRFGH